MLPESTCGQVMLLEYPPFIEFIAQNKPKYGHYMLPSAAILWVKLHFTCHLTHKFAKMANLCFQKHKMGDDSGSKSCVSISIIPNNTRRDAIFLDVWQKAILSFFGKLMVPELTCGKDIVPINFYPFTGTTKVGKKTGKLMLPIAASI